MSVDDPKTFGEKLRRWFPLLVIIVAFITSAIMIATRRVETYPPDAVIVRLGHWQVEAGLRETLKELADEFVNDPQTKARHPGKKIVIVPTEVPDPAFQQWIACQLMGGTAPDMCEVGLPSMSTAIWLQYETRYFEPLTDLATAPNPYNKVRQEDLDEIDARVKGVYANGKEVRPYMRLTEAQAAREREIVKEFERVPLSQTYLDGMRGGYREELQAYTKVPLSRFAQRIFYNKTLYKKLTGKDVPPLDYREFLKECDTFNNTRLSNAAGNYSAIASSKWNTNMFNNGMWDPMTFAATARSDFNRDGTVGSDETFAAFKSGRVSFESPEIKAKFLMTAEVQKYFQTGYVGLQRDEAVMKFAKQQAVFLSTGTWDVGSLVKMAEGQFEVGIAPFPQPSKDDPEFGRLMLGPYADIPDQGFAFGISRFAKHPEVAKDFILFLASRRVNQRLNHAIGWLPALRDVALPEMLSQFASISPGMARSANFRDLGGDVQTRFDQDYGQFQVDGNYDEFLKSFKGFYLDKGLGEWDKQQRDWRLAVLNGERRLAVVRGMGLLGDAKPDDPVWVRYRALTAAQQVMPEVVRADIKKLVTQGPPRPVGPYEFLPEAIENIKKNAQNRASSAGGSAP